NLLPFFPHGRIFVQTQVGLVDGIAADRITPQVAERVGIRARLRVDRDHQVRFIEVVGTGAQVRGRKRVANNIRPVGRQATYGVLGGGGPGDVDGQTTGHAVNHTRSPAA